MINPPQNQTALDGKDATIACEAEAAPAPNVTWYFNDGEISFSGRLQILEDGSLLISKVRSTDEGKYTCERSNEAGSVREDAWISVLVRTQIIQVGVDYRHSALKLAKICVMDFHEKKTNIIFEIIYFLINFSLQLTPK